MAGKRPTTIAEYIRAVPLKGQPHLPRLYEILRSVAPEAEEAIKWGTPFFVLFAFSSHKAHCSLALIATAMEAFSQELEGRPTTRGLLKSPYNEPVPEDLVRRRPSIVYRK